MDNPFPRASAVILAVFTVALVSVAMRLVTRTRLPYPPGPSGLPVIGNLFDMPQRTPWRTYALWSATYGGIIHFSILGQHFVVINSEKIAEDLLEKRSKIYSSKPVTPMIELMEWDWAVGFMPYGESWRKHRRLFHEFFRPKAARAYLPAQMQKVHEMLRKFLVTPADFPSHLRHLAASIVMKTVYGYDIADHDDHFVDISEKAVSMLSTQPETLVNILPMLRYLPTWFPGATFQSYAATSAQLTREMRYAPWDFVKEQLARGTGTPSIAAELLDRIKSIEGHYADENICRNVAALSYTAGADTIASSFSTAMLAMILNPGAVEKAQAEIDSVIGPHRLPIWEDRASLPYVEAFYREVMRWHPVAPLGLPRSTTADDIYDGNFIPKGTTVIANIWAMARNPRKFANADVFMPERYLTSDGQLNEEDTILAFGHGRRICAGRYFADTTMWAALVSVLAAFNVSRLESKNGEDTHDIGPRFTDGLVSHPVPFKCSISPRSATAERLVRQTAAV